jgi:mono/diheme cytochrome c family protein
MHDIDRPRIALLSHGAGWLALGLRVLVMLLLAATAVAQAQPRLLSQTGLGQLETIEFTPVHPLWSDGTAKRRWIHLPARRFIDARDPDAWVFPRGTRLWKQFAYGSRVETRYIERRSNGGWIFATYVWRADGSDAELASASGIAALPVDDAPGGRYVVPSHDDCRACHGGARSTVLGFSALQLGEALPALVGRGLIRNVPRAWRQQPPRIQADSDAERAARGYLHGNCGHCHHETGVPVPLVLAQRTAGPPSRMSPAQLATALRRMASRNPYTQMPPLGTRVVDGRGLALVRAWAEINPEGVSASRIASPMTSHVKPQEQ